MMPKPIVISAVIVALAALTGCEAAKSVAGLKKQAPDEFEVVSRAPLSIPPDFGLRSPAPGAERPQELNPREQAKTILLRNSSRPEQTGMQEAVSSGRFTRGEAAILAKAGAVNVDPSIRQKVNQESTALAGRVGEFHAQAAFLAGKATTRHYRRCGKGITPDPQRPCDGRPGQQGERSGDPAQGKGLAGRHLLIALAGPAF